MMAKDGKSMVTPRLRFPEFRKAEKWKVDSLSIVATFVKEKTPVSIVSTTDYVSTENLLPDYGGMAAASKLPPTGSVTRYQVDDVLISNIRPYLKKVWHANRNGGASNDVIVVRAKTQLSKAFLSLILKNDSFIACVMRGAKGLKMPRGDINSIAEYPVGYPREREQQKIADCLMSLDEVIAVQGLKVEALKAHKRGLMQQLFPRVGEIVPRLRFPEFRGGPKWQEAEADQLFANRTERGDGELPIYSVTMNDGLVKRSSLDRRIDDLAEAEGNKRAYKNDIAYNMMRMWQGACGVAHEDCMVSPAYVVLSPQTGVHSDFYGYFFKLPQMLQLLTSHSRGLTKDRLRLYYQDFGRISLPFPDIHEQQRIADYLTSLDTLIAAESEKLVAVKAHKKGLMQQLFPSSKGH